MTARDFTPPGVRSAFTLIELLIVVAIIAILAAIAVPNFLEAQVRSKVSRVKADMRSIATGLESYAVDNNRYPDTDNTTVVPPIKLGIGYSRASLIKISTPIAYLTSGLLDDVFALGAIDTRFFGYANCKEAVPFLPAVGVAATPEQQTQFVAHLWILQSVGPDRINFALAGTATQNFPLAFNALTTKADLSFFYDPTNGTVSTGDVVRTGQKTN